MGGKIAVFTSKKYQIIKILRNKLGIVFLIFQRLIWAAPFLSFYLPTRLTYLNNLKVISVNRNFVGKCLSMTHWKKRTPVFIIKTTQVQELQKRIYIYLKLVLEQTLLLLWDFIFEIKYLMTEFIFNKNFGKLNYIFFIWLTKCDVFQTSYNLRLEVPF